MSCSIIEGVRFWQRRQPRASHSALWSDRWCATPPSVMQKHRLRPASTRPPAPTRKPRLGRAASTTACKRMHALSSNSRWARSVRIVARPRPKKNGRGSLVPRTAPRCSGSSRPRRSQQPQGHAMRVAALAIALVLPVPPVHAKQTNTMHALKGLGHPRPPRPPRLRE